MGGLLLLLSLAGCREDAEAAPCDRSAGTWVSPEAGAGALQAAVDAAGNAGGAVVGLLPGAYVEALRLGSEHDGVRVIACPGTVEVAGVDAETPVVEVDGGDGTPLLSFDGLRLVGGRDGVYAEHGTVGLHDVEIVDAGVGSASLRTAGVYAAFGAVLDLDAVRVEGAASTGVVAWAGDTRVTLADTVIAGVRNVGTWEARGIGVYGGAEAVGEGVAIEVPDGAGVLVDGGGSALTLDGGTVAAGAGAAVTVSSGARFAATGVSVEAGSDWGVVVEGTSGSGAPAVAELDGCTLVWVETGAPVTDVPGVMAIGGASLTLRDSTVTGARTAGLLAEGPGTLVSVERSSIGGTRSTIGGEFGDGVLGQDGAAVEIVDSWIEDNHAAGVVATAAGTRVSITDTRVGGTRRGAELGAAVGVAAQSGGEVAADRLVVTGTEGPGLYVAGGSLSCAGCTVDHNTFAGALVLEGEMMLSDSTITETGPDAELGGGVGVYASDWIGEPRLGIVGVEVGPHRYAAVWIDGDGSYQIAASSLAGSAGVQLGAWWIHGNALFATRVGAWSGTTGLRLDSTELGGSDGVGVLLHDASATLLTTTWTASAVDLLQQHCVTYPALDAEETAGAPVSTLCPGSDLLIDTSMVFRGLSLREITIPKE